MDHCDLAFGGWYVDLFVNERVVETRFRGFVAGIRICQAATDAIGMPDHGAIVWDEVIGFGVTMIAAPAGWEWVLAGFVLFRLFDVLKPWPISWFDRRIHGGLGIMLDDLIAGLFALLCMQLLARW